MYNLENETGTGPGPRGRSRMGRGGHGGHGGHPHRGRGFGRPGGWQQADLPPADDAAAWFIGRLAADWVVGEAAGGNRPRLAGDDTKADTEAAAAGRISRFREDSRAERMKIADEAESRYGHKV